VPAHRSRIIGSPWAGVHGTHIESARQFSRHWHDTFGLGLLEQGAQRSASGRGQVDAQAGDLMATNPGEVHDGRPLDGTPRRWRMIYVEPAVLMSLAVASSGGSAVPELSRPVFCDPELASALQRLFARLDAWSSEFATAAPDVLACEESLVDVAGLLLRDQAEVATTRVSPDRPCRIVSEARDRLADALTEPPTLDDLAAGSGLSKFQLLRRFQRAYGLPPHAWLMQRRVEHARGLVGSGTPPSDAAAFSGFADQSHMTRAFVRRLGFTPGAWRRAAASW
jgi:AraC-like DNA-binding protein